MGTAEWTHFTDEETKAEREIKSLLGVQNVFLGEELPSLPLLF